MFVLGDQIGFIPSRLAACWCASQPARIGLHHALCALTCGDGPCSRWVLFWTILFWNFTPQLIWSWPYVCFSSSGVTGFAGLRAGCDAVQSALTDGACFIRRGPSYASKEIDVNNARFKILKKNPAKLTRKYIWQVLDLRDVYALVWWLSVS